MSAADLNDLGPLIRAARREKGLTQQVVADAAGLSRVHLLALEYGRAPEIGFRTVLAVMNAVGLDLRLTAFDDRRPTLDDLQARNEDEDYSPRPW